MRLTATTTSTKAAGTPASRARRSVRRCTSQEEATATGSAATARTPTAIPMYPYAPLLFDIGATICGGRDRATDQPGDGDQGQQVRQRFEQRAVRLPGLDVLELRREGACEPEQQARAEGAERTPLAEDQCGERDESSPGGHVLGERVDEPDREEDSAHRRQPPGRDHRDVPHLIDRDPDRVCRTRVLSDRPDAEAERGSEEDHPGEDEDRVADPDQQVEAAEHVLEEAAEPVRRDRG